MMKLQDIIADEQTRERCRIHLSQGVVNWDGEHVTASRITSNYYGDVDCWCVMAKVADPRDTIGFLVSDKRCQFPWSAGRAPATE